MAMEYFNYIKARTHISNATKSEEPVLSEEDEKFLTQIASNEEEQPPPLPARPGVQELTVAGESRGNDAQLALMDGAQNIKLPETPDEIVEEPSEETTKSDAKGKGKAAASTTKKPYWSWMRRDSRNVKQKDQVAAGASLADVAEGLQAADVPTNEDGTVKDKEAEKEEEDMTVMLERLNLAAVNNRVFSISDETQELLKKFNFIFKDLVNGVPTAYGDLESLLTNGDKQLQKTYSQLPGFLQKLIEQLPKRLTQGMAPEMLAVMAARAESSGINMQAAGKAAGAAKKMRFKAPNLKDLIGKPGAAATMLRSTMAYLRARFPAFLGMNVLWSLALFVVLLVFWYCHKRGREVRLEKERELTEKEVEELEKEYETMSPEDRPTIDPDDAPTTTAPDGASMEEVQAGMREVQEARQAVRELNEAAEAESADGGSADGPSSLSTTVQPAERVGS